MPLSECAPLELFWKAVPPLLSRAVQELILLVGQPILWEEAQAYLCCREDTGEGMPPVDEEWAKVGRAPPAACRDKWEQS